jgi:4-hydroxy-tetrahydrodipicolinate reductase
MGDQDSGIMNLLLLGRGKMGALVDAVASMRKHKVRTFDIEENRHGSALTLENLRNVDVVIDFTAPDAVMENIAGCVKAGKNLVVGTTGWYDKIPRVRKMVEDAGTGFIFGANFSIGVNLFFEIARSMTGAFQHEYSGRISERHHIHKKDAPSGTAVMLRNVIKEAGGPELEISSYREGEVVGMHELLLDSPNDTISLRHDAKSRRGFAEGAVRAAEWLQGKKGFYDFKDIWRQL